MTFEKCPLHKGFKSSLTIIENETQANILLEGVPIENVKVFTYLGTKMTSVVKSKRSIQSKTYQAKIALKCSLHYGEMLQTNLRGSNQGRRYKAGKEIYFFHNEIIQCHMETTTCVNQVKHFYDIKVIYFLHYMV